MKMIELPRHWVRPDQIASIGLIPPRAASPGGYVRPKPATLLIRLRTGDLIKEEYGGFDECRRAGEMVAQAVDDAIRLLGILKIDFPSGKAEVIQDEG